MSNDAQSHNTTRAPHRISLEPQDAVSSVTCNNACIGRRKAHECWQASRGAGTSRSCVGNKVVLHKSFPKVILTGHPGILIRLKMTTVDPCFMCPQVLLLLLSHCCGQQFWVFRFQLSRWKSEKFRQAKGFFSHCKNKSLDSWFSQNLPGRSLNLWNPPVVLTWRQPSSPREGKKQEKLKRLEGGQREVGEQTGKGQGRGGEDSSVFILVVFTLCVCTHTCTC